ncbi:NLGN4X [Branchiostoma lanceolatum]|uniref:Carboxylic ester hydrolase n=1 Tax=Branchiostoma lanceolatum TaxID=7740 RepID=A0A8J9W6A5_BRALA|nr:NLGN4X [Branchiostoma lanceolatum]
MAVTTYSQLLVFAALVFVGRTALLTKPNGPIVRTQYGAVRGMFVEEGTIFLGLPFVVPPVGELRWKPPRAHNTSWAPAVRDGTVPGPACRQPGCGPNDTDWQYDCNRDKSRTQSEDCLYLNVFVPRSVLNSTTVRLPVMCWFHGGNYRFGTGSSMLYDGRILANKTNTVVVTTNYRLGAFGYLVTGEGEDDARGNYGTLDQIEALKWVQQNIADFGGDKDKVTIFGQSAGSDSVAVLLTSDRAANLFHQGIMLSVPFTIAHKTQFEAIRLGNEVTKLANCSAGDMKCLRSKPADDILRASESVGTYIADPFRLLEIFLQWGPTVDGDVLPRQTVDSFAKGQFQRKPFIVGTVGEEGVLFIYGAFGKPMSKVVLDAAALAFLRGKGPAALREYNPPQASDYRPVLSHAVTDWVFECATRNIIRNAVASGENDVWLYVFDHVWSFKSVWHDQSYCNGHVCHGEDVPFVFQTPLLVNLSFTADEQVMSDTMAYHYGNFAHTGDPNKPSRYVHTTGNVLKSPLNWPRYNEGNQFPNMNFTTPQNVMVHDYNKEKCDFWDKEDIYLGTD